MPVQGLPPKQIQDTTIYGMGGVNLRTESTLAPTETLEECLDFDLHLTDGAATTRRPSRTVATLDGPVTVIKRAGEDLYAGTSKGTLYRNWSQLDTGYGESLAIEEYVPQNRTEAIVYLAGALKMKRLVGQMIYNWGIERPSTAPTLTIAADPDSAEAPAVDGHYSVVYTYVVKEGSVVLFESNPSPASTIVVKQALNLVTTPSAISATITAPSDPQVTHIRLYRTQDGGPLHLFDTEVQDNGTNRTVLLVKADDDLGAAVDEDNDPPIVSSKFVIFQDRGWIADDYNVYYSKRTQPQAFPQLNYLTVGNKSDPIVGLVASRFGLGVFTRRRRFRILESVENISAIGDTLPFFGGSTTSFIAVPSPTERGGVALRGIVDASEGVVYTSDDGIYITDFTNLDQGVSLPISSLFLGSGSDRVKPVSRTARGNSVLGVHDSKRLFSYTEEGETQNSKTFIFSSDNQKWYTYNVGATAIYSDARTGYLYIGSSSGTVGIYDDYSRSSFDAVSAYLSTHRLHGGVPYLNKLLQWVYVNAEVDERDSLTGTVWAEGGRSHTFIFRGNSKIRVPGGLFGREFRVSLAYSGEHECVVRGIQLVWLPMRIV